MCLFSKHWCQICCHLFRLTVIYKNTSPIQGTSDSVLNNFAFDVFYYLGVIWNSSVACIFLQYWYMLCTVTDCACLPGHLSLIFHLFTHYLMLFLLAPVNLSLCWMQIIVVSYYLYNQRIYTKLLIRIVIMVRFIKTQRDKWNKTL